MKSSVPASDKPRLFALGAVVLALHVLGWGAIWLLAADYPVLLGLAGLAYSFGLRHAFDADHIAAIDNTTRRLMHEDRRPLGVGLYFSLGHSTVVFLMTLAVALAAQAMAGSMPWLHDAGRLVGTTVSGVFLYVIGILNLIVMIDVYRVFRRLVRGDASPADMEARLLHGGFITRWFGGLFRLVRRPWQMYLVGFLFGLGFDTATEIALLTTAGLAASQSLPLVGVLALPVVFAAGMTLMDTADGILMCGAYGWAFANPLRKVFYNLTITGLSVAVALIVGTLQLASIAADRLAMPDSGVWSAVRSFDAQAAGYLVAGLFIASWIVSLGVWKLGRFDQGTS